MRVIETTAHIGEDGMLRLEVPFSQRNFDVRVAVVVESPKLSAESVSIDSRSSANDPWGPFRDQFKAAGLSAPAPDSWTGRGVAPLQFDGSSVAETLVEDRR